MQGWHYGKGLIYYGPIFRLTKLALISPLRSASLAGIQFCFILHIK